MLVLRSHSCFWNYSCASYAAFKKTKKQEKCLYLKLEKQQVTYVCTVKENEDFRGKFKFQCTAKSACWNANGMRGECYLHHWLFKPEQQKNENQDIASVGGNYFASEL